VGCVAVVLAMGGTATALDGTDTVEQDDLQDNSVGQREIRTNAIRRAEINNGAVQDAELGDIVVRSDTNSLNDGSSGRAEVECNAGERMIGGGGMTQQSGSDAIFHGSHPSIGGGLAPVNGNTFDAWNAKATNAIGGLATVDVVAWAICLQ
jgi:hypothetical protein